MPQSSWNNYSHVHTHRARPKLVHSLEKACICTERYVCEKIGTIILGHLYAEYKDTIVDCIIIS